MPTAVILTLFVLARLTPLSLMLPSAFVAGRSWRWSLVLLLLLAVLVVPPQLDAQALAPSQVATLSQASLAQVLLRESLLGLSLGFGFTLILGGLQLTAVGLGQMTGLAWMVSPNSDPSGSPSGLQRYFGLLTAALFLVSGGHRQLVSVLLESFRWLPPGQLPQGLDAPSVLAGFLTETFQLGIRAAAPIAFCLMVTSLLVAILGRGGSMLGGFGMTVTLNLIVLLFVSWASLGVTASVFQQTWSDGLRTMIRILSDGG